MKNKGLIVSLIIVLSIISILLIVFMINIINGGFKFSKIRISHKVSNKLVLDKTYNNNFTKIYVNSNASDIDIKHSTDNQIRVVIYGDKDKTTVSDDNNELKITIKSKSCIGICINNIIAKTIIYLPEDYSNNIKLVNNYGDIKIDKYLNANIDIKEDCGDVSIKSGKNVTVDNSYGDITLDEADTATIRESAGDIDIGTINNITANNNYGDITIDTVNTYLNLKNDCGDIEVSKISITKNSTIKDNFGNIEIGNTNEIFINAKTDLGDININNNYHKSNIKLEIKNDCGDIEVNN